MNKRTESGAIKSVGIFLVVGAMIFIAFYVLVINNKSGNTANYSGSSSNSTLNSGNQNSPIDNSSASTYRTNQSYSPPVSSVS